MNLKIYSLGCGKKGDNIMGLEWNNVKPACCAKWLVLPTVYSDALSYGEQLDKFCYQLNQLIENNNILPDFIAEMIKEYINSGAIGEVVRDILADYILNVKYPPKGIKPAVGDGSADDTEAIQGCIDYASNNGGVVYFPYGSYLTQSLTMKDGVSLFGFDRYSTKIVLKGGATKPLISGTVARLSIANLTLDGNSGIQVNDVNVVAVIATDMLMTNLVIKDGYTLVNYYGSGGHLQISDIIFGNAVEKCLLTAGNANVQAENLMFNQLSAVGGICVLDIGTDGGYFNVKSVATCDKCIVVSGNNNNIVAIVENATTPITDNGLKNNIEIAGISDKQYFDGTYSKHIGDTYTKNVDGNATESYNRNYNKDVGGESNERYNRNYSKVVDGKSTESYHGNYDKVVDGESTETYNTVTETFKSKNINGETLNINTKKPVCYKTPTKGFLYDTIPLKDSNKTYNVMVENENSKIYPYINVKELGAKGDGVTDDTSAIQETLNNYAGRCIFFPVGVYKISATLTMPNDTYILGEGVETILEATDNFTGIMLKSSHFGNSESVYDYNFKIYNITLDGKYANYVTYEILKNDADKQHGICIKGEQFEFDKIIVRNFGGNGIMLENNAARSLSSYENAGTAYIINSKIMYNGLSGIVNNGCVDWVLHNCDVHSNSRKKTDAGNNLTFNEGNAKISDCHLFKLYGAVVPYSDIFVAEKSGNIQVTNCHIEGATNPLVIYGNRCFFVNCRFYSSFGACDLRINADYCTFDSCEFFPQVTDALPGKYPEWLGAVVFEKESTQKNNSLMFVNCSMQQTNFTHDTSNMGVENIISFSGNGAEVGAVDFSKSTYNISGYFNQGNTLLTSTKYGLPVCGVPSILDMSSDLTLSSTYIFINSYTSGKLITPIPVLGALYIILNNTSTDITLKCPDGVTINGANSMILKGNSVSFLMGNTSTLFKGICIKTS